MGSLHYAKFTTNHLNVKLRCLKTNPIFKQPKQQFSTYVGANCAFISLYKTTVDIHPQEMRNIGLVGLVLSLHHPLITVSTLEPSQLQKKLQE